MMIALLAAGLTAAQPAAETTGRWTWTLYEDSATGAVTLANEIPDTPRLRATFECQRGAAVATVTLYEAEGARSGFVDMTSGDDRASVEARAGRSAGAASLAATLPTDHPVFLTFLDSGALSLNQGDRAWPVRMRAAHLEALSDFAALCAA